MIVPNQWKLLLKPCSMICGSLLTLTSGRRCPLSSRSTAPFAQVVGSSGSTDISHSWLDNLAQDNLTPGLFGTKISKQTIWHQQYKTDNLALQFFF